MDELLGAKKCINFDEFDEDKDEDYMYMPAEEMDDDLEEEEENDSSDASLEQGKTSKKKMSQKGEGKDSDKPRISLDLLTSGQLPKGKLRAEIQAHRKIVALTYAPANVQLRGKMQGGKWTQRWA